MKSIGKRIEMKTFNNLESFRVWLSLRELGIQTGLLLGQTFLLIGLGYLLLVSPITPPILAGSILLALLALSVVLYGIRRLFRLRRAGRPLRRLLKAGYSADQIGRLGKVTINLRNPWGLKVLALDEELEAGECLNIKTLLHSDIFVMDASLSHSIRVGSQALNNIGVTVKEVAKVIRTFSGRLNATDLSEEIQEAFDEEQGEQEEELIVTPSLFARIIDRIWNGPNQDAVETIREKKRLREAAAEIQRLDTIRNLFGDSVSSLSRDDLKELFKESDERNKILVEETPGGVITHDGVLKEEELGKLSSILSDEDYAKLKRKELARRHRTGRLPEGGCKIVETPGGIGFSCTNIEERYLAMEALRQKERAEGIVREEGEGVDFDATVSFPEDKLTEWATEDDITKMQREANEERAKKELERLGIPEEMKEPYTPRGSLDDALGRTFLSQDGEPEESEE